MGKQVIYETRGRAREYNDLAINLFTGCGHSCVYCYGPKVLHKPDFEFRLQPAPRLNPGEIQVSAANWQAKAAGRNILLCFLTDPYQPIEEETKLTRTTIELLHLFNHKVTILTKGGLRSMRDFDMLRPGDEYATTLTLTDTWDSLGWEPYAAPPEHRIKALQVAHELGIKTWVSFEPVIYPEQTMDLLTRTLPYVDHYKVGIMNYFPLPQPVDWGRFGRAIEMALKAAGKSYYLKADLRKAMEVAK